MEYLIYLAEGVLHKLIKLNVWRNVKCGTWLDQDMATRGPRMGGLNMDGDDARRMFKESCFYLGWTWGMRTVIKQKGPLPLL